MCGRGNNAGDGYIVAGCARASRTAVQLIQLGGAAALTGDAALARDWAVALGVTIVEVADAAPAFDVEGAVIVDALMGTGRAVRYARALRARSSRSMPHQSRCWHSTFHRDFVRIPAVCSARIRADVTVTFIGMKRGLVTGSGPDHTGDIVLDTLGVPDDCHRDIGGIEALQWSKLRHLVPPRAATAYKHQSGQC